MIYVAYGYAEYFAFASSLDQYCFGLEYQKWKDDINREEWHIENTHFEIIQSFVAHC
jgi:hypothetical protein